MLFKCRSYVVAAVMVSGDSCLLVRSVLSAALAVLV